MPMPEAAVNENHGFVFRKNDIRATWQLLSMQPKAITHPMQQPSHSHFRRCILSPDPAHIPAPALRRQMIPPCHAETLTNRAIELKSRGGLNALMDPKRRRWQRESAI